MERRAAPAAGHVGVGAPFEQQPRRRQVAVRGRRMQRRQFIHHCVHVGAGVEQRRYARDVASLRGGEQCGAVLRALCPPDLRLLLLLRALLLRSHAGRCM